MNFKAFTDDIIKNRWNVFGAEVYIDGKLTNTFGDTETHLHEIYSATKTVLSIAVGIAFDEGKFDLQRSILYYLPEENIKKLSSNQKITFEKITIERLLTMSVAGFPFRAEGGSYIDFALSCNLGDPNIKEFNYSNISPYLVGVALTNALGSDLSKYIEERILEPLNINRYSYSRCPEGFFYSASGMSLTVNSLSRLGLLLFNNGTFEGNRIVSEKYVKLATSVQQMNREGGYGYFVWKYRDGFSINGKWGQKCYILPTEGIIVSFLSHIEEDTKDLKRSMERNILGVNVTSKTPSAFPR